jgi:predicted GNAT family N-acyltransferase
MYRLGSDVFLSKQQCQHVEIGQADVHVFLAL